MAAFSKSFFSFPPPDPDEPGFQQDNNRSLKESHSTGKELTEYLSQYDDETITSLDGKKYNVLAQREGSADSESYWSPTPDVEGGALKIAQGLVLAPWDDRTSGSDEAGRKLILPKQSYKNFYVPDMGSDPTHTAVPLDTGGNYYWIKATFTRREYTATTNTANHNHGGEVTYNESVNFDWKIYSYHLTGPDKLEIVHDTSRDAKDAEDTDTEVYQFLGEFHVENKNKVSSQWRTGHVFDFRMPTVTMLDEGTQASHEVKSPANPNS